jgi:protoporphyrinogen oxidase
VDFGTHIPVTTGDPEIDEHIVDVLPSSEVHHLATLRSGSVTNGWLNSNTGLPDVRGFDQSAQDEFLREICQLRSAPESPQTEGERLRALFGGALVGAIFDPALQKFYGAPANALGIGCSTVFGLSRVVMLDASASRMLKEHPHFDARLGFHGSEEGQQDVTRFYPRNGGVGAWTNALISRVRAAGVTIKVGARVTGATAAGSRLTAINVDGTALPADRVIWTAPLAFLLRLLGADVPGRRPRIRTSQIDHFVLDNPPLSHAHYVTVFDPAEPVFRVTLYSNFAPSSGGGHAVTVETIRDDVPLPAIEALASIVRMGLVEPAARASFHLAETVPGFPSWTTEFERGVQAQREAVSSYANLALAGKAAGNHWTMGAVMREARDIGTDW